MKYVLAVTLLLLALVGCTQTTNSVDKDKTITDNQMKIYQTNQPTPVFNWSQPRDNLIQIYKQTTQGTSATNSVFVSYTGQVLFQCPSIGSPIPADTQLTNPSQIVYAYAGASANGVVQQAEPNGLYTSTSTSATWVLCVRANGDVVPVYSEPQVMSFPFAVKAGPDGQIKDVESSPSTMSVKVGR